MAQFTIVTPVLNRASTVGGCIESVARQFGDADTIQHVIIDGGSDDGTLEVLANFPHIELVHEPVRGIYVAMNRGLSLARHEVVGIVNSDDLLEPGTLAAVSALLAEHPKAEVIAGRGVVERVENGMRRVVRRVSRLGHLSQNWDLLFHGSPTLNARFFRRYVLERYGFFNTSYSICADREMLIRLKLAGVVTLPVDQVFYRYLEHDDSATLNAGRRHDLRMREEHIAIAESYLSGGRLSASQSRCFRGWIAAERARNALAMLERGEWGRARREAAMGLASSAEGFLGFLLRRAVVAPINIAKRRL